MQQKIRQMSLDIFTQECPSPLTCHLTHSTSHRSGSLWRKLSSSGGRFVSPASLHPSCSHEDRVDGRQRGHQVLNLRGRRHPLLGEQRVLRGERRRNPEHAGSRGPWRGEGVIWGGNGRISSQIFFVGCSFCTPADRPVCGRRPCTLFTSLARPSGPSFLLLSDCNNQHCST